MMPLRLVEQCPCCGKALSTAEIAERWCDDCSMPTVEDRSMASASTVIQFRPIVVSGATAREASA